MALGRWARIVCAVGLVMALGALLWGCADLWTASSPSQAEVMNSDSWIWVASDAYSAGVLDALPKGDGSSPAYVPGQLIVQLNAGKYSNAAINTLCSAQGVQLKGAINPLRLVLVQVPSGQNLDAVRTGIAARSEVQSVDLNYVFSLCDTGGEAAAPKAITNDPYFGSQWGMWQIGFNRIPASVLPTAEPTVAVVDTGVDYNHPDITAARVIKGADYVEGDMDPQDTTGHGTHVAGIIAAINNNNVGVAGVAGASKILAVRVGTGSIPTFSAAAGVTYAADQTGVKVMNLSWGGTYDSSYIRDAIAYAVGKGILVVAAAGNANDDGTIYGTFYPVAYPGVLGVGATYYDESWDGYTWVNYDEKACFSNYGSWVDIAAPGQWIRSTLPGNSYQAWSGTSMASPMVAGAAALVWGKFPAKTAMQIADVLVSTAHKPIADDANDAWYCDYDPAPPAHSFDGNVGRLDLYAALASLGVSMTGGTGCIEGIVVDANTGLGLQGATVTAKLQGTTSTFTATTRPDGTYAVINLPAGDYRLSAAKATYVTAAWATENGGLIHVDSGNAYVYGGITMPKTQASDTYTAVLSWWGWMDWDNFDNEDPYFGYGVYEQDSYLWLPGSLPPRNQFMAYWRGRGNVNAHPWARLLRDEPGTTYRSYGPFYVEATTFKARYTGQYVFAVDDALNPDPLNENPGDWLMAVVQLYKGSALVGTYPVDAASGSLGSQWWVVFTVAGPAGAPVTVNTLADTFPGPYGSEFVWSGSGQSQKTETAPSFRTAVERPGS